MGIKQNLVERGLLVLVLTFLVMSCSQPSSSSPPNAKLRPLAGGTRYVATNGLDSNPGTSGSPYRTIQKCATSSASGDTCLIGAGTYRETVVPNSGVSFQPNGSVIVTVDGSDPVTGWTQQGGNIFKASIALNPNLLANQVFVNTDAMFEARWPNSTDVSRPVWATMKSGTTLTTIVDSAMPSIDWNGGIVHWFAGTNPFGHETATITSSGGGQVSYSSADTSLCPYLCPKPDGLYYLLGKLGALDSATEWYYDKTAQLLYFWAPGGVNPNTTNVRAKQRDYAFDLRGKSNVAIKNINLFSNTIIMNSNSADNMIDGINAKYLSHFTFSGGNIKLHGNDTGIIMDGTRNTIKNSTLAYSAGSGVALGGSSNVVTNNLIHDMGYHTTYATGR